MGGARAGFVPRALRGRRGLHAARRGFVASCCDTRRHRDDPDDSSEDVACERWVRSVHGIPFWVARVLGANPGASPFVPRPAPRISRTFLRDPCQSEPHADIWIATSPRGCPSRSTLARTRSQAVRAVIHELASADALPAPGDRVALILPTGTALVRRVPGRNLWVRIVEKRSRIVDAPVAGEYG